MIRVTVELVHARANQLERLETRVGRQQHARRTGGGRAGMALSCRLDLDYRASRDRKRAKRRENPGRTGAPASRRLTV